MKKTLLALAVILLVNVAAFMLALLPFRQGNYTENNIWLTLYFDDADEIYCRSTNRWLPVSHEDARLRIPAVSGEPIGAVVLPTIRKERHNYDSWTRVKNDTHGIHFVRNADIEHMVITESTDLYVRWVYGFLVLFNFNGGLGLTTYTGVPNDYRDAGGMFVPWYAPGADYGLYTVREIIERIAENRFHFNTPVLPGYVFDGWYFPGDIDDYLTPGIRFTARWVAEDAAG
jgi:hypothetical protein